MCCVLFIGGYDFWLVVNWFLVLRVWLDLVVCLRLLLFDSCLVFCLYVYLGLIFVVFEVVCSAIILGFSACFFCFSVLVFRCLELIWFLLFSPCYFVCFAICFITWVWVGWLLAAVAWGWCLVLCCWFRVGGVGCSWH